MRNIDWDSILQETNVDLANSKFEDSVNAVMNEEAPMKVMQPRNHYCKWLNMETKGMMSDRDIAREAAKVSNSQVDWDTYKFLRNACTKAQCDDKKVHLRKVYSDIEEESNPAKLFSTTKNLLGWSSGGPPTSFIIAGQPIRKQELIAETQATFYAEKVLQIKKSLPGVNRDPLHTLRKVFARWEPLTVRKVFSLKTVTPGQVEEMIKKN